VQLDRIVGEWMMGREVGVLERLAVDGKTLRGSGRTDGKPLQLLSAVTHRLRLSVAQLAIAEKATRSRRLPHCSKPSPDWRAA